MNAVVVSKNLRLISRRFLDVTSALYYRFKLCELHATVSNNLSAKYELPSLNQSSDKTLPTAQSLSLLLLADSFLTRN